MNSASHISQEAVHSNFLRYRTLSDMSSQTMEVTQTEKESEENGKM